MEVLSKKMGLRPKMREVTILLNDVVRSSPIYVSITFLKATFSTLQCIPLHCTNISAKNSVLERVIWDLNTCTDAAENVIH